MTPPPESDTPREAVATDYEIAREAARAAREAAREAVDPEARFFLKRHAELLERMAATRRRRPGRAKRRGTLATGVIS